MLDLVKDETNRIDSRFLEPACGSGNFLVRVLQRKLAAVEVKFGKSGFEKKHYALFGLMCIYGIELLEDNIAECRANLIEIMAEYLRMDDADDFYRAASAVLSCNLVHGDALTMRTHDGEPITFAEWGYLGRGKFQRRDFRLDALTGSSKFSAEGSLFAHHTDRVPRPPRRGGAAGRTAGWDTEAGEGTPVKHAYIATALAVLLGLGTASADPPAAAQQQGEREQPAAGAGERVAPEELGARAEERFGAITGGAAELTRERLAAAMPELDAEDVAALFREIDANDDDAVSREEWRAWSERLFGAAGGAGGLTIEQYREWERTGRITL